MFVLTRVPSLLAVFYRAYQFNIDVSKWNVAKVSDMFQSKYSFLPSQLSRQRSALHCFRTDARARSLTLHSVLPRLHVQPGRKQVER